MQSIYLLCHPDGKSSFPHFCDNVEHIVSVHVINTIIHFFIFFVNPHSRICLLIFVEREEGWGERGKETSMSERNIDLLPSVCTLIGD